MEFLQKGIGGQKNSSKRRIGDTPKDTKNLRKGIEDLQDSPRVMEFLGKDIGRHKKPGKGDWGLSRIPHCHLKGQKKPGKGDWESLKGHGILGKGD